MNTHPPRSTCGQAESEYNWTIGQVTWPLTSLSSSSSCKILSSIFLSCSSDNTVSRTCAHRQTDRQTPRESIPVNLYLPFAVRIWNCAHFIPSYKCVTIRMCTLTHIHVDIHYITPCSQCKKKDLCKQPHVPKLFPSTNTHTASNRKLSGTWEQG